MRSSGGLVCQGVIDGVDGQSAPYYVQEWYAWSNVAQTASVTTSPFTEPYNGWSEGAIPANTGGLAYLWRKSVKYTYNAQTNAYDAGTAQYVRLSGTNGTSINTKGSVEYVVAAGGSLPTTGVSYGDRGIIINDGRIYTYKNHGWSLPLTNVSDGDSYTVTKDNTINGVNLKGHLMMWSDEAHTADSNKGWVDLGIFQGQAGITYYTHVAWATNVDTTIPWSGTIPAGQISTPNYGQNAISGGQIVPASDGSKPWMGVLINTNPAADTTNYHYYTWSYTKGAKGENAEIPASLYKWVVAGTTPSAPVVTAANYMLGNNLGGWSKVAPNRSADGYNLWLSQNTVIKKADGTYEFVQNGENEQQTWSTPVRISGDKGEPGEDSKVREQIYKRSDTQPATPSYYKTIVFHDMSTDAVSGMVASSSDLPQTESEGAKYVVLDSQYGKNSFYIYHDGSWDDAGGTADTADAYYFEDDGLWRMWNGQEWVEVEATDFRYDFRQVDGFVPDGWTDHAQGISISNPTEWTSCRDYDKSAGRWGAFQTPIIWSHWGENGMDGDGVQYVYKLFDHELSESERISNIPTKPASMTDGEWIPTGWSDNPLATTSSMPYCYCSVIKRINGTWGSFEKLGLWSRWSEDGESPIVYSLKLSRNSINFRSNALGEFTPSSVSVTCGIRKTVGNTTTDVNNGSDGLYLYYKSNIDRFWTAYPQQGGVSVTAAMATRSADPLTDVEFCVSTSPSYNLVDDSNIVVKSTLPVMCDGRRGQPGEQGQQGATGRMSFPSGEYSDIEYTRDENECPIVHYTDGNGNDTGYWYLDADTNVVSGQPVAPADTPGNPWKQAKNFGLVITEALFAAFARLGSFVVSHDYFISQYGTLFIDASTDPVVVNTVSYRYNNKPAYMCFRDDDPMAEGSNYPKFRPRKVVNALTGEEYLAEGKVRIDADGNVTLQNLDVNDATIRGSIMYHKVVTDNYQQFSIADRLGEIHVALRGDIFVASNNGNPLIIAFPPAYLFPSAKVKILVSYNKNFELMINRLDDEESKVVDEYGEVYNGFVDALDTTPSKSFWGVSELHYGPDETYKYKVVELVSVVNPIHPSYQSKDMYCWMVIDAR